jgi:hypothetical protein
LAGCVTGAVLANHHSVAAGVVIGLGIAVGAWTQAALIWLFVDIHAAVTKTAKERVALPVWKERAAA